MGAGGAGEEDQAISDRRLIATRKELVIISIHPTTAIESANYLFFCYISI